MMGNLVYGKKSRRDGDGLMDGGAAARGQLRLMMLLMRNLPGRCSLSKP